MKKYRLKENKASLLMDGTHQVVKLQVGGSAKRTRKRKHMSEADTLEKPVAVEEKAPEAPQLLIVKKDEKGRIEIRADNGSAGRLEIYIRHPVLADVVEKMGISNYPADQFDDIYKPVLLPHPNPGAKGRVVTRSSIYQATKNIVGGTDFDFSLPPRGILISNPEALRKGFSLFVELKAPVPHDVLRKWGEMLKSGCSDIISASRPFTMQWVMTEKTPTKL